MDMNYDDMPAGREMNDAVCVAVGIEPVPGLYTYPIKRMSDTVIEPDWDDEQPVYPEVSTSISAAWEVVEKLRRHIFQLSDDEGWCCTFSMRFNAKADTAPLAICRAALRATVVNDGR